MSQKATTGPPSEDELRTSIEQAGYPFELRVFEVLRAAQMSPRFGWRSQLDETPATREIDIMVGTTFSFQDRERQGGPVVRAELMAFVQAKRIHDGAFIGFADSDRRADPLGQRRRLIAGGAPSYGILPSRFDGHGEIMYGLVEAFGALEAPHHCVQWTVARRAKGEVRADHEAGTFEDISSVIQASLYYMHRFTMLRMEQAQRSILPDLSFALSALVIDAPLYAYNVNDRTLTRTEWLSVTVSVDTFKGVRTTVVDVLTFDGIAAWTEAHKKGADVLRERLESGIAGKLATFAPSQREAFYDPVNK